MRLQVLGLLLLAQPTAALRPAAQYAYPRSRRASSPACQFKMPWDGADEKEDVAAAPPPPPPLEKKKNAFTAFMESLVRPLSRCTRLIEMHPPSR